ncbi:MAG: CHC2 zinc finger domain-containing protein [Thermodesulfobacteriota bacterium]
MTRFSEDYNPNKLMPAIIETIKSKLSLEEVVREYALLFDSGGEFIGKCPFIGCDGSIVVDNINSYFHCASCERNGDVLGFIMEIEYLTLRETIKVILSRYAGL